jgi:hypothetical protein
VDTELQLEVIEDGLASLDDRGVGGVFLRLQGGLADLRHAPGVSSGPRRWRVDRCETGGLVWLVPGRSRLLTLLDITMAAHGSITKFCTGLRRYRVWYWFN